MQIFTFLTGIATTLGFRSTLIIVLVLLAAVATQGDAGQVTQDAVARVRSLLQKRVNRARLQDELGPMCGIYAACRSLDLLGIRTDPRRYFTVEFVSDPNGSTPAEVAKIVRAKGAKAVSMVNLSKVDIMLLRCPLIANVRSQSGGTAFNHWVCSYWDGNSLLVFDGAGGPVRMSFADFLALWNGYGIIVARSGEPLRVAVWLIRLEVCCVLLAFGFLCWQIRSRMCRLRKGTFAFASIVAVSAVVSLAGNAVFGDLSHIMDGVRTASVITSQKTLHRASLKELMQTAKRQDTVLIDARHHTTFELGAIKGAINIPVGTSELVLKNLFDGINRALPLLVYCQSAKCNYDEIIANKVSSLGFRNVVVSTTGWAEYCEATSVQNDIAHSESSR